MCLQKMVLIPGNSLPLRAPKGHESIAQGLPWVFCFMHRALKGAPEPELDSRAICRVHRNGIISQGKRSAMLASAPGRGASRSMPQSSLFLAQGGSILAPFREGPIKQPTQGKLWAMISCPVGAPIRSRVHRS
jgi:hypothetical protein